jgi:hypothetical protein
VFILYGVVIGLIIGVLTRGSPAGLGQLRFRWSLLVMVGMAAQLLLFSSPMGNSLGLAAPAVYMATNGVVLTWSPGTSRSRLPLVLLGGASNLLAMIVNGGYMPVSRAALEAMGHGPGTSGYSNSALLSTRHPRPLTDIFAMPVWLPVANVFQCRGRPGSASAWRSPSWPACTARAAHRGARGRGHPTPLVPGH